MMGGVAEGPGARALEPDLLAFVESDQAAVRADLALLARPLRLVVPSGALRAHLAAALVRAGRPLLGVRVQTLASLAREALERHGVPPEREDLFPILVSRCARREPSLRAALEELADGYGAVQVGVDDLLDAGFTPDHAAALDEALAAQGLRDDSTERALVRVAREVAASLGGELGAHRSRLFAGARDALERDADAALPARAVAIYGFSDATGVQTDLLVTLIRELGARVWLELPPRPGLDADARESAFGASFRERLCAAARGETRVATPTPARIEIWRARDPFDEARAVAGALRAAIDAGAEPERIAVVARDLAPHALALRRGLTGLGVPFSGAREPGPVSPAGRRLGALLSLLREGGDVPAERWLEALWRLPAATRGGVAATPALSLEQSADLRHALHARGCAALSDAAAPSVRGAVRIRLPETPRSDASGRLRLERRALPADRVDALRDAAASLLRRLEGWPARDTLAGHARRLRALARDDLGWDAETPGMCELEEQLDGAGDATLERAEFVDWLARALDAAMRVPIGGRGGGVALLSVMEARGLTFERVFLLGLNRGVFPRGIREDPLLPDSARRRLRDVLPDLPVKRDGFDEERFLFAQTLASAEAVMLSFSRWDAEGRVLAPSPLLDALTRAAEEPVAPPVPGAATPRERACEAGLAQPRERFGAALELALEAARAGEDAGADVAALTRARVAVLGELDPRDGRRRAAGPYLGFVGRARAQDARAGAISVTALEGLARCGWQVFLRRLLDLSAVDDARGALPGGADRRLLGNVVHGALERIAASRGSGSALDALRDVPAEPLAWPEPAALEAILLEAAEGVVREESIALASYAHGLASRARSFVLEARRADWDAGAPRVLGAEVKGALLVAGPDGSPREISFKADRVDRHGDGLRLTDYKTGEAPGKKSSAVALHENRLRERIAQGTALQASVYAAAAGAAGQGRYLHLRPDLPAEVRELAAPGEPERFATVVGTLLAAWDLGAFVPRLRGPANDQEPITCQNCDVKEACLRGDSGVRLRLGEWATSAPDTDVERAARALWRLPEAEA
jgi:hypothetical protein